LAAVAAVEAGLNYLAAPPVLGVRAAAEAALLTLRMLRLNLALPKRMVLQPRQRAEQEQQQTTPMVLTALSEITQLLRLLPAA
jgi:hypothetical protein